MKKVLFFVFILVSVFIINNLVRSIISLWQKQDLVVNVQDELETQKRENEILRQKLAQVETKDFIEIQAREKLLYGKEGEREILLPRDMTQVKEKEQPLKDNRTNWEKWINLFF